MRKQEKAGHTETFARHWKRRITALRNAVFPEGVRCIACDAELRSGEGNFCAACRETLPYRTDEYCPVCGEILDHGVCPACKTEKFYFDESHAPFMYTGLMRKLILRYKSGEGWLSRYFGEVLADHLRLMGCDYDLITWVPADRKSRNKKGYDHAGEIAKRLAKCVDAECVRTMKRIKPSGQKFYDRAGRKQVIAGAFTFEGAVAGKRIVLVDDVMTTGYTVNECARVLKENGAEHVTVFTVAR